MAPKYLSKEDREFVANLDAGLKTKWKREGLDELNEKKMKMNEIAFHLFLTKTSV